MAEEELDDYARLVLRQSLSLLANELEQLAQSLRGKRRQEIEALCAEAREAISTLNSILEHRAEQKRR